MTAQYPSVPDPTLDPRSLRESIIALKQGFEILTGQRGNTDYAALLAGDTLAVSEEGTFTPSLSFVTPGNLSVTYSAQFGHYIKVGRLVIAWFNVTTSAFTHTTASGTCTLSPLPFSPATNIIGNSVSLRGGSVSYGGVTKAGYTSIVAIPSNAGARTWTLQMCGSGVAADDVTAADMPTGGAVFFRGTLLYLTNE